MQPSNRSDFDWHLIFGELKLTRFSFLNDLKKLSFFLQISLVSLAIKEASGWITNAELTG